MPSMTEAIRLVIEGDSSGAVKALGEVADGAAKTQGVFGKYGEGLNTASNYAAAGVVALTGVIVKSAYDTQQSYSAIKELMRMTGDSAEEASTLAGQWDATGLSVGEGSAAMLKFSKNLQAVYDGSAKANPFADLGVSVTDANGEMRDSAAVLADVQAAMSTLESPTQRTAIAVAMFGKSGDDLLSWLTKTPAELDALNKKLKEAGLVWSDEDIAAYADAAAAQRDLQISLKGVEQTIARDVVPAMTPLVGAFAALLRFIRPASGVLAPLTVALATFVGVVKGGMIIKDVVIAVKGFALAVKGATFATSAATLSIVKWLVTVPAIIAANVGLAASYAAVGLAAGAAGFAIYEAIDAYNQWQSAVDQAKGAESDAATANEAAFKGGHITQAQYESNKAVIIRDAYQTPWYMKSPASLLPGLADEGIVKARPGGTIVRLAEGGVDEAVIKASRLGKAVRAPIHVQVNASFIAMPTRSQVCQLTDIISRELGLRVARLTRGCGV